MYNTFERLNESLATEERTNKKLKLVRTLKTKHMRLQTGNSLDLEIGCLRKMFNLKRIILKAVPRDAGEWKLPATYLVGKRAICRGQMVLVPCI